MEQDMLKRSHVVFYSKVALLIVGVAIVIGIVLFSGSSGYEAENRVGNWVLSVRVMPMVITADDNITVETIIKYVGSDNFTTISPLMPGIRVTSDNGTIYYDTGVPPIHTTIEVTPGFSETFQYVVPPLPYGTYNVKVHDTAYNPNSISITITVVLPMEVKP
jgi:hypothetical protein